MHRRRRFNVLLIEAGASNAPMTNAIDVSAFVRLITASIVHRDCGWDDKKFLSHGAVAIAAIAPFKVSGLSQAMAFTRNEWTFCEACCFL